MEPVVNDTNWSPIDVAPNSSDSNCHQFASARLTCDCRWKHPALNLTRPIPRTRSDDWNMTPGRTRRPRWIWRRRSDSLRVEVPRDADCSMRCRPCFVPRESVSHHDWKHSGMRPDSEAFTRDSDASPETEAGHGHSTKIRHCVDSSSSRHHSRDDENQNPAVQSQRPQPLSSTVRSDPPIIKSPLRSSIGSS